MNAYELADELENYVWVNPNNNRDYCKEVKDMLRKQADRIAELSKNVDELEEALLKATHPNAEPVAWFDGEYYVCPELGYEDTITEQHPKDLGWIPLYTTPQIKELSDEEILSFTGFKKNPYDIFIEYEKEDLIDFARAILKKASEK